MLTLLAISAVIVFVGTTESQGGGNSAPRSIKDSCDFENNTLCGWKNVGSASYVKWKTHYFKSNNNYYARLDFNNRPYSKGRLASPWFNAETDCRCQLQFIFFVGYSYRCRLTVIQETHLGRREKQLWNSTGTHDTNAFSEPILLWVGCTEEQYRIVFEGERLSRLGRPCYRDYNEIDVDDIVLYLYPENHSTFASSTTEISTTALPSPTAVQTSETTTVGVTTGVTSGTTHLSTGRTFSETNNDTSADLYTDSTTGALSTGELAGIVVAVFAVFVAAVVVFIFVRRRKQADGAKRDYSLTRCSKQNSKPFRDPTDGSRILANVSGDNRMPVTVLGNARDRPKGDNADPDHVLTAPDNHYVNVSNDNDSPHRGYELLALPSSSKDAGDSSTNRYTHVRLKGSKGTALSDQVDDDTYDHTEAQQGRQHPTTEDEYAVPHKNRKFKPSAPAEGNTVSKTAAAKGSTVYEIAAVESSIAYQNAAGEDYDRVRVLADRKQGGDVGYSLTHHVHASDNAEAAAAYALAETTDYETVGDDGRLVTSLSSASGDVYNRLNASGGPAIGQKVRQNHYDHITDPAGTGAEYSSLGLEERARDLKREMAEGDYSHI